MENFPEEPPGKSSDLIDLVFVFDLEAAGFEHSAQIGLIKPPLVPHTVIERTEESLALGNQYCQDAAGLEACGKSADERFGIFQRLQQVHAQRAFELPGPGLKVGG